MPKDQEEKFGIEFIDPDEFIRFIEEGDLDSDKEATASAPSIDLSEEQPEDELEPELTYTDRIAGEAVEYVVKKQEDTRGRLAVIYTLCTFLIFIIGIVIAVLDGILRQVSIVDNLSKVLPLLSGIFLGTLGFVIGYYFRKDE